MAQLTRGVYLGMGLVILMGFQPILPKAAHGADELRHKYAADSPLNIAPRRAFLDSKEWAWDAVIHFGDVMDYSGLRAIVYKYDDGTAEMVVYYGLQSPKKLPTGVRRIFHLFRSDDQLVESLDFGIIQNSCDNASGSARRDLTRPELFDQISCPSFTLSGGGWSNC